MKKLCLAFSACAALAFSSTVNAQNVGDIVQSPIGDYKAYKVVGENLFVNGSFEDESVNGEIPGWYDGGWNNAKTEVLSNDGKNFFRRTLSEQYSQSGKYRIDINAAGSTDITSLRTFAKVTTGQKYMFVGWTKTLQSGGINIGTNAKYNVLGEADAEKSLGSPVYELKWANNNQWTQSFFVFNASKKYVTLKFAYTATSYLDNFYLAEVEEVPNIPLLKQVIADVDASLGGRDNADVILKDRLDNAEAVLEKSDVGIEEVYNSIVDVKKISASLNNALKSFREKLAVAEELGLDVSIYNQRLLDNASTITATELNGTWSNDLNVDEFYAVKYIYPNEIELGEWVNDNVQTRNTDHWSGAIVDYYNVWNNKSDNGNLTQNINLPAGEYVLKVAVRGSNSQAVVTLGFDEKSDISVGRGLTGVGIDQSGNANFSTDGTYANSGKGFGWQYRYIPLSLSTPKNVKISVGLSIAANQRANVGEITLLGRFYSRKVASGDYGTICLPYEVDMESVSGVDKVYSVSSMTNDLATLTPVEAMEAGKPYIFKASADEVIIPAKVGGAVVGTPQEDTYLVGTFADIDKMDYGTYVLSGNKFCKVVEGNEGDAVTLGAYRCYFKPLANGIKNFGFVGDDGETTGIDKIESEVDMKNAVIYDLTGRRVTSPVKGIYIVNGKKMVIDNLK